MTHRVVVVGATENIGRPLCRALVQAGRLVTVFSRNPDHARQVVPGAADYMAWSPARLPEQSASYLEWADAVVYLAGGPLFDGRRRTREELGYQFCFPVLDAALRDLLPQLDDAAVAR